MSGLSRHIKRLDEELLAVGEDSMLLEELVGFIAGVLACKRDCDQCALKSRCCPRQASRRVPRSIYEGARDMARQIARSWEGRTSRRLLQPRNHREDR